MDSNECAYVDWQSSGKVKKFSCVLSWLDALRGLEILVALVFEFGFRQKWGGDAVTGYEQISSANFPTYYFFVAIGAVGPENLGQRKRVLSLCDRQ